MQAAEQNRMRQYRCTPSLSFPRQWSQQSELEESPSTFSAALKRPRRRTIVVIGACRRMVDLLGLFKSQKNGKSRRSRSKYCRSRTSFCTHRSDGAEISESAQNSLQKKRLLEFFQAVLGSIIE